MRLKQWFGVVGLGLGGMFGCGSGAPGVEPGETQNALEVGGECVVADALIGHSCAHANSGPFASATAQAYPGFVFTDISQTHTAYTVTLPGSSGSFSGAVLYSPGADGRYAFFTTPGVPLAIVDASGQLVPLAIEAANDPALCALIDHIAVFNLDSTQTYTLVFGPSGHASTQTIVEFMGEGGCETCAGVDLDASRSLSPWSHEEGESRLDSPLAFQVPGQVNVLQGPVRVGTATLTFRAGHGPLVQCLYGANRSLNAFKLLACSGHLRAGDNAEADYFKLAINPGAALFGPIFAELEISNAACAGAQ